ncbi:MAG: sulfatase-like hydrolase/transferase, partial [Pseudomonadota bacterium]
PFRYGLQTAAIPVDGAYGLDTDEYLLPQMLKKAGYRTVIVGKWHLGHADEKYWPLKRGFDYQYGPLAGEVDYYTHFAGGKMDWYENQVPLAEEGYATRLIGRKAVQIITDHDPEVPLFLYLTFTAPHAPYQVPEAYENKYPDIKDETRRAYAGMVTAMDDEIARVLTVLDRKGMRSDTLVIFMSDNGGNRTAMFSGESDVSDVTLPASNAPYSGGKGTILEGGTRVVATVNWPGQIKPGTITDPIHVVDFLPTIAGLAGATTERSKPLDGFDQWTLLSGNGGPVRTEVIYNIEPYRAAAAKGNWKLIMKAGIPPAARLYDLSVDPAEEKDIADQHPEIAADLQKLIFSYARQTRAPLFFKYAVIHSEGMEKFLRPMMPEK